MDRIWEQIARRLRLLTGRAVIRMVNDSLKEQEVQLALLSGELGQAERYQHYGFTSHPHPGGEAIFVSLAGSREHLVVIADGDRRYRLKGLAQGEVAMEDDQGQVILLKRGKQTHVYGCDTLVADVGVSATITCPQITAVAAAQVTLNTPLVQCTGALQVAQGISCGGNMTSSGNVSDSVRSMAADRAIYNGHTHNETQSVTLAPNQQQ